MSADTRLLPVVHVILPAYNEAVNLGVLLDRLAGLSPEFALNHRLRVYVVDDGSSDGTREVARRGAAELDVVVLSHARNQGLGRALATGISSVLAAGRSGDYIIVMDADDTHDVQLIPVLVACIRNGADVSVASRFAVGGSDSTAPAFRRVLSRAAAKLFNHVVNLSGTTDFTSGYRAYRFDLMHQASVHWGERLVEEPGFACMVELLMKLSRLDPICTEVPMILRYDRKRGPSKLKMRRTIFQYCALAARNALSPRIGFASPSVDGRTVAVAPSIVGEDLDPGTDTASTPSSQPAT